MAPNDQDIKDVINGFIPHVPPIPEAGVLLAVMRQAVCDLYLPTGSKNNLTARRYFKDGTYEHHCDLLDLDHTWVTRRLVNSGVVNPSVFQEVV